MSSKELIKVWDLPLRFFHWLLVIAFFSSHLTKGALLPLHIASGYCIISLLVFRLLWGFFGSKYARFSQFFCRPRLAITYLKELNRGTAQRYIGHNPAGSAMIMLLLLSLSLTVFAGLLVYGAHDGLGPFYFIGKTYLRLLEKIHKYLAYFCLGLVPIHIMGVIVESIMHHENLVTAMFHGNKRQ